MRPSTTALVTLLLAAFALVLAALGVLAPDTLAAGEGPGWALTARTFPTNLVLPKSETQELSLKATGGTFVLVFESAETTPIPYGASGTSVQAALDALPTIGGAGGNVAVTGGPDHYLLTFGGTLGSELTAHLEVFGAELTGSEPGATVTVTKKGATSGSIVLREFNVGARAAGCSLAYAVAWLCGESGTLPANSPITVTDTLPAGLRAKDAGEYSKLSQGAGEGFGVDPIIEHNLWSCTGDGPGAAPKVQGATTVTCTNNQATLPLIAGGAGLPAGPAAGIREHLEPPIAITVEAEHEQSGQTNSAVISGGGAPTPASAHDPITVSSLPAKFAFTGWDAWFSNADGTIDRQAGSHPYSATFTYGLPIALNSKEEDIQLGGEARTIEVQLPPGFIGVPRTVTQCSRALLSELKCPSSSLVGVTEPNTRPGTDLGFAVYNMEPPAGVAAEFGFNLENIVTLIDSTARTGAADEVKTTVPNIAQKEVYEATLTLWGEPQAASHNPWRDGNLGGCRKEETEHSTNGEERDNCLAPQNHAGDKPFLTLPTSCGPPQPFAIRVLSGWQDPTAHAEATVYSHDSGGEASSPYDSSAIGFTGCEDLAFGPGLSLVPEVASADSATGLTADATENLGGLEEKGLLAPANIKHVVATLPVGFSVNPGQAAGLQACQETAEQSAIGTEEPAHCPAASKIGTARIKTPLLESDPEKEAEGTMYLLQSNPPQIHVLIAASADGVNLKLVGIAQLNKETGQITTTFGEDPQVEAEDPFLKGHMALPDLPASDFKLTFEGGAKAALVTPSQCGTYAIEADFASQASPFISDLITDPALAITSGAGGGACPSATLPFNPSFTAGSTSADAGQFTGFTQLLARGDGTQRVQSVSFKEPGGLAGLISSVPLCQEPQAAAGTCSPASRIGHAIVQAGPGSNPLTLPQPGGPEIPIYLTGPYKGAPFGLTIVTPLVAGPFNLGTEITRARIEVDPHTAQITITTDPLPQIIKGVPTDIRSIYADIDRPGFLFNPTNCNSQEFTGTAYGTPPVGAGGPGSSSPISSHFGIGACKALTFSPTVGIATAAKASRVNGASLSFKIAYPKGALGSEAWFNEAQFVIPKQLPSRLATLQKACLAHVYETERQNCPAASKIGTVIVRTPVLPVPLQGSVYFVSFGGAKFPDVVLDLYGDNVHIELDGETLIHNGITSATFRNTPDVPFENIEVTVPTGRYSEFAANLPHESYDFCGQKLVVPTFFKAQNGLEIHQNTPVTVTGCPKGKTRAQKLAAAMRACHKKHGSKRASCEKAARRAYGAKASKHAKKH